MLRLLLPLLFELQKDRSSLFGLAMTEIMKDLQKKAILIDLINPAVSPKQSADRLIELEELVKTYGGIVIVKRYQKRVSPHPRTFIGPGKVEELGEEGKDLGASLLIINDRLKSRQIYTIMEMLRKMESPLQVWDRIDLILKIFAKHARTTEAKLEIELASIRHMGPRIYGMGMELSRQGGGIGTSGVGETNTEIMRRHLKEKERMLEKKLEQYETVRAGHRKNRTRNDFKTVAIVGYTNAGKTTLLNRLTRRKEYAANELFATLDTRVGSLYLAGNPLHPQKVLVSDTIGFIQRLPPELLKAFASTLSEAVGSDVLLLVVDGSDSHLDLYLAVVQEILQRLGVADKPRILVVNKIDALKPEDLAVLKEKMKDYPAPVVFISAGNGEGMPALIEAIEVLIK